MATTTHVLLAEDDSALAFVIKDNLEDAGYKVTHCANGEDAWREYQKTVFDICLLDVMMPVRDGFSLAKKIRQKSDVVPILFISAKAMEADRLTGFQSGADDYITKPFSMKELLLRMEVFLRRTRQLKPVAQEEWQIGALRFLFSELKIEYPGGEETVTPKEAELLQYFCRNKGKILKREEVLLHVWGKEDYFLGRSMDVFITKLRRHLKADPKVQIETIHGVGFRLSEGA
jgi:DNA-binding response OmpR family regulator